MRPWVSVLREGREVAFWGGRNAEAVRPLSLRWYEAMGEDVRVFCVV